MSIYTAGFFADDCVLFTEIASSNDQLNLNKCLCSISQWCNESQMLLNSSKSVQMRVTRKRSPLGSNYCIQNSPLQLVHEFKYLGVIISSNLSRNSHISWTAPKASAKLWSLKRRLKHCTPATKLAIYTTVMRPDLEYADVVWDPATKLNID